MKISLNKEMLEKIKSLKGKMVLATAAFTLGAGLTLAGCGNADAIEPTTPVTSEVVSEEVSEIVSEEISEEVSEEISEEVVEEEFYSAQEVMTLIDELIAKYQYNNPEHIKSLVIAANLDYITAEDLDTILATYGYSMDELSNLYMGDNGVLYDATISYYDTYSYHLGTVDSVSDNQRYENRICLESVMLNEEDKIFAREVDNYLIAASQLDGDSEVTVKEFNDYDANTSGEKVVISHVKYIYGYDIEYNPYNEYQNINMK